MAEAYYHHSPFFVTPVAHPVTGRQNHVLPCYKETTGKCCIALVNTINKKELNLKLRLGGKITGN